MYPVPLLSWHCTEGDRPQRPLAKRKISDNLSSFRQIQPFNYTGSRRVWILDFSFCYHPRDGLTSPKSHLVFTYAVCANSVFSEIMPDYQVTLVVFSRTQLSIPLQKTNFYHTHEKQTKNILLKIVDKLTVLAQIFDEGVGESKYRGAKEHSLCGQHLFFWSRRRSLAALLGHFTEVLFNRTTKDSYLKHDWVCTAQKVVGTRPTKSCIVSWASVEKCW